MTTTLLYFVYFAVVFLALTYIGTPLVVFLTMKANGRPTPVRVRAEGIGPKERAHFDETARAFQELGFELVATISVPGSVGVSAAYAALWQHRAAGHSAAAVIFSQPAYAPMKVQPYVEFSTMMMDGMVVMTNNCSPPIVFKKVPKFDTLRAPTVRDPREIYRLHLYRESTLLQPDGVRYLPAQGAELEDFVDGYEYPLRLQVAAGYYRRKAGAIYRPTPLGALMMTWAVLPPMKGLRAAGERARARTQLEAAQSRPIAPAANVRISHESPYRVDP